MNTNRAIESLLELKSKAAGIERGITDIIAEAWREGFSFGYNANAEEYARIMKGGLHGQNNKVADAGAESKE